jgi:hypothetical protein
VDQIGRLPAFLARTKPYSEPRRQRAHASIGRADCLCNLRSRFAVARHSAHHRNRLVVEDARLKADSHPRCQHPHAAIGRTNLASDRWSRMPLLGHRPHQGDRFATENAFQLSTRKRAATNLEIEMALAAAISMISYRAIVACSGNAVWIFCDLSLTVKVYADRRRARSDVDRTRRRHRRSAVDDPQPTSRPARPTSWIAECPGYNWTTRP